jgi:signal transduction histidine kinase
MKQEVVAMVTHDLRSPVSSVRHFLEMLESNMLGELNDRGKKLLKAADKSTIRMLGLINDLLDIEKIKSGMFELDVREVSTGALLESSCQALAPLANAMRITIDIKPEDVLVSADEERIARVVTNLVSNALKFSPAGTSVTVESRTEDGFAVISIRDQGRGIPADLRPYIFDRFTQVMPSDSRQMGGSGLGLAISRAIVELHGGKIWVESGESAGSTFSFTLPLSHRDCS